MTAWAGGGPDAAAPAGVVTPTGGYIRFPTPSGPVQIGWTDPWDNPNWRPYPPAPLYMPPPHWFLHSYYGWILVP